MRCLLCAAAALYGLHLYADWLGQRFYRRWLRLLLEEYEAEVESRRRRDAA